MTNGGRHTALRTRIAASKPATAHHTGEVGGIGAPIGKAKTPPGRSAAWTPAKRAGRSAGRKCPKAPKLTARSYEPASSGGSARASARTRSMRSSGCARAASASMPALRSTPVTRSRHSRRSIPSPAPVPQHTSSPSPKEPSYWASVSSTASSMRSGVRNGVWSNLGESRSYPRSTDERACTASSRTVGPWEVNTSPA